MLRRRGWFRVLSLLPVFLLAGLAASSASSASSASPAPPRPVTLQLKWKHQFQFAGYYAAAEKGYYREAGLDVRIVEAQEGRDAVDAVLAGEAEYGVGTSDLLLRRARGQKVVVLGVVFQHSALVLLVRRGPHLGNVHELAGKRVMLQPGEAEVLAYLRREGVFPERLTIVPHSFDVAALIEGKVDALSAYSTDEPFVVRETGMDVLVFTPRAAGIDFYGDNLFTTEAEIEAHPERVRAFRAASLRGWRYAIEHPGEIADLILARFGPRHSREHLLFEAEEMKRLLQPALVEPGYMNPGRWRHMADTYAELGMLPPGISLQGFLYDPDPKVDLKWLYRGLGAALALILAGGLFLLQIVRLNRRLEREVKERRTAEEKFRGLVEQSLAGTYIIQDGLFVYVNSRFAEMFGYQAEEIIGRKGPLDLCSEAAREEVRENLRRRVDGETQAVRYSFTAVRKDGSLVEVDVNGEAVDFEGRPAIVGVALDVTESRRAERQLSHLAFYDPLTDLPNRALFFDRLGQVLTFSQRGGEPFALLLLDLDGFKAVNDSHGHETGDALLQGVAQRLKGCVRESDTVARTGGDEFVVLLPHLGESLGAPAVASKIIEALRAPFPIGGHECQIGASIGLCISPEDGQDMEALLRHADAAMYESKARGKNTWTRYRAEMLGGRPVRMAFFEWTDDLHVGVPVIDEQHRQLADLLGRVADSVKSGQGEERVDALLEELVVHARRHFAMEERLMERFRYADALFHGQEHRKLMDDLLSIRRNVESGSVVLMLQSLKEWLVTHVRASDMRLGEALVAAGAAKGPSGRWSGSPPRVKEASAGQGSGRNAGNNPTTQA